MPEPTIFERQKDTPEHAARFLFLILTSQAFPGNERMSDERLAKAFHLVGTLGLAAGLSEGAIRDHMAYASAEIAERWSPPKP